MSPSVGRILRTSRRFVQILDRSGAIIEATVSSKALDVTVGDAVEFESKGVETVVVKLIPARNSLARSYRNEVWRIAANLDHLFIVASVFPLFNNTFIDKVLLVAALQSIPVTLILNKNDLDLSATREALLVYETLGVPVLFTSAKEGSGIDELRTVLGTESLRIAALTGVSGVGKSSLLNQLIPQASTRTGEVSARTGQGRQTTTQAVAYLYPAGRIEPLLLIDLPGMQNFGVNHLRPNEISYGFIEIAEHAARCEFSNCRHLAEPRCAVKDALESGAIAPSRYESYLRILTEVEEAQPY